MHRSACGVHIVVFRVGLAVVRLRLGRWGCQLYDDVLTLLLHLRRGALREEGKAVSHRMAIGSRYFICITYFEFIKGDLSYII